MRGRGDTDCHVDCDMAKVIAAWPNLSAKLIRNAILALLGLPAYAARPSVRATTYCGVLAHNHNMRHCAFNFRHGEFSVEFVTSSALRRSHLPPCFRSV